jgi:phosphoglycolate phosphatase
MPYKSIIFDLDGTLIDSAPSILSSLQAALGAAAICPNRPLDQNLIGPPLAQIMAEVLGDEHQERIPEIIELFKVHYDTTGYLNTIFYPGIPEMLAQLQKKNIDLYIATNKRITPTLKILNHLGWSGFFKEVYSLDYFKPAVADKATMLARVVSDLNYCVNDLVYVGDRSEDAEAAQKNSIPFLFASWGYGEGVGSPFSL